VVYTVVSAGNADSAERLKVDFVCLTYDHERLAAEMASEGLPEEAIETIRTGWWTTAMKFSRTRSVPTASIEISQGTGIGARLHRPAHSHELVKTVRRWFRSWHPDLNPSKSWVMGRTQRGWSCGFSRTPQRSL
jgi:hypothetical protein